MRKIPTVFERDWNGDKSLVLNQVHPGCEWVLAGEGIATRKYDGQAVYCDVSGKWFKRRELKVAPGVTTIAPDGWVEIDADPTTNKIIGWVPIGDGPEDKWLRAAVHDFEEKMTGATVFVGTGEAMGHRIQGGAEGNVPHFIMPHGWAEKLEPLSDRLQRPRTFESMRDFLEHEDIEGIVFHHPDGRMAKIKKRDFGLKRKPMVNA